MRNAKAWHLFSHCIASTHHLLPETRNHPSSWIGNFMPRALLFWKRLPPSGSRRIVRASCQSYFEDLEFHGHSPPPAPRRLCPLAEISWHQRFRCVFSLPKPPVSTRPGPVVSSSVCSCPSLEVPFCKRKKETLS